MTKRSSVHKKDIILWLRWCHLLGSETKKTPQLILVTHHMQYLFSKFTRNNLFESYDSMTWIDKKTMATIYFKDLLFSFVLNTFDASQIPNQNDTSHQCHKFKLSISIFWNHYAGFSPQHLFLLMNAI